MTRAERNEFNYIRRSLRDMNKHGALGYGTTLTIRTDAGTQYKTELDSFYTELGFHPAGIRTDERMYDDKERIVYIYGLTWKDNEGNDRSWTELYTRDERANYKAALA